MSNPADINSAQYVLASLSTASAAVTVEEIYKSISRVIVDNTAGSSPVFVVSGRTSPTAVFPSSATVASVGSVVGAGTVQTYMKDPNHNFIAAIRQSGTADLYIKLTQGD